MSYLIGRSAIALVPLVSRVLQQGLRYFDARTKRPAIPAHAMIRKGEGDQSCGNAGPLRNVAEGNQKRML